jgi:hypothetical protein
LLSAAPPSVPEPELLISVIGGAAQAAALHNTNTPTAAPALTSPVPVYSVIINRCDVGQRRPVRGTKRDVVEVATELAAAEAAWR